MEKGVRVEGWEGEEASGLETRRVGAPVLFYVRLWERTLGPC